MELEDPMAANPNGDVNKIGVSTCLLGKNVRYNSGHAKDLYIMNTLVKFFKFIPVCPETECGLGVPRKTMHLEGNTENPHLITTQTGIDHTLRMLSRANEKLATLEKEPLCGFIFKKNSPSCNLFRVKVYLEKGAPSHKATGIFAKAFVERFPRIPVEEEGRLNDPGLRENFIERVFVLKRWREQ